MEHKKEAERMGCVRLKAEQEDDRKGLNGCIGTSALAMTIFILMADWYLTFEF
jgi:hypothetical protein